MRRSPVLGLALFCLTVAHASAEPGRLIALSPILTYSKKSLDLTKKAFGVPVASGLIPSRCAVNAYKVVYETTDLAGAATRASGLLLVPNASGVGFSVVSFQHGTTTHRESVPSRAWMNAESAVAALVFGSMNYIVSAPDYLGLGDSPGVHPYLNASTEASAARDMLLALPSALAQLGQATNGSLFLAGYSQGGHATMALHRAIDAQPVPGFSLRASVPMAGPYDLSETSLVETLATPSAHSSSYVADLLLMAVLADPSHALQLSSLVGPSRATQIEALFDGQHTLGSIDAGLPDHPRSLFLPAVLQAIEQDPAHPLRMRLAENDVYAWRPAEPTLILYASGDTTVSPINATRALAAMQALGAPVIGVDVGSDKDHKTGVMPSLLRAFEFLDSF